LPGFELKIPKNVNNVDDVLLDPRKTWSDQSQYEKIARELINKFRENFKKYDASDEIKSAGPI